MNSNSVLAKAAREREEKNSARLAQLASALGHPARLAIIRVLSERTTCVCNEIVAQLPLAQSTVSQHLKVLKDAGWIQGEIDAPRICYCLNPDALDEFRELLDGLNIEAARDVNC